MKKKITKFIIFTVFAYIISFFAFADTATDITQSIDITVNGKKESAITDNSVFTHFAGENLSLLITGDTEIGGIYIKYNTPPPQSIMNGKTPVSLNGFLHEYIDASENNLTESSKYIIEISYPYADICDVFVYSKGSIPAEVQMWQKGENDTDLLLCATHSDDDQLFFAGLLPYYAKHKGVNVRVAYFINHYDTQNRTHELLDGLWHCGVTNYPDISPFPDGYSESSEEASNFLKNHGFEYDDLIEFQRNLLEKYKPLVAVLHDFNGEYGHGAHMLNTETFIKAVESASSNEFTPEKIYIHLYGENTVNLPIDEPLDCFSGKSAFNVSQEAFGFHKSQHWTWFYNWIYGNNTAITKASQIRSYSPLNFGLYYTRVGYDTKSNDFFENVPTYKERRAIELEQELLRQQKEKELAAEKEANKISQIKRLQQLKEQKFYKALSLALVSFGLIVIFAVCLILVIKNRKK